jgi:hypothetical protein
MADAHNCALVARGLVELKLQNMFCRRTAANAAYFAHERFRVFGVEHAHISRRVPEHL